MRENYGSAFALVDIGHSPALDFQGLLSSERLCAIGHCSSPLEHSDSRSKGSAVLVNEFLQCPRRTATDFLNQIIRPGEDTVLMIDGDFTQMLDDEGISLTFGFWLELAIESPRAMPSGWFLTPRGHHCQHRLTAYLLILHLPPQDPGEDLG